MTGFLLGVGVTFAVWLGVYWKWVVPYQLRLQQLVKEKNADNERLRQRNVDATSEGLEWEMKCEGRGTALADAESRLHATTVQLSEVTKRAEVAEGIVRGQAKHIDALQGSNDTMLRAITDMRRVGFSLPSDVLNDPDPETITSVHDDDLQALKDQPHLAAADDL